MQGFGTNFHPILGGMTLDLEYAVMETPNVHVCSAYLSRMGHSITRYCSILNLTGGALFYGHLGGPISMVKIKDTT